MSSSEPGDMLQCPNCDTDLFVRFARGPTEGLQKCEMCGETFSENNDHKIEAATDKELDEIYFEFDEFYTSKSHTSDLVLHLPYGGIEDLYCQTGHGRNSGRLRTVGVEGYPKGYAPICKNCLKVWREE
jgi:hypothetical protein